MTLTLRLALLACLSLSVACSPSRSSRQSGLETLDGGAGSDGGPTADGGPAADAPDGCVASPAPEEPPPAPPDHAACTMNLDADFQTCENACLATYPEEPNPHPVTCPDGYEGSTDHARIMCVIQCAITRHNAKWSCCTTAGIDGKPIDLGGTSEEVESCHGAACWNIFNHAYLSCLSVYAGYTGHEHFNHPCKIDALAYCDDIYNSASSICVPSWRALSCTSTACNVAMPCGLDNWITELGHTSFQVREAAHARILHELRYLIRTNPTQMQCVINIIRGRFLNHPSVMDLEVASRLRLIWFGLVHDTLGPVVPPGCPSP